jgi:CTP synthase (UTP-ammonia lyase)
MVPQLEAAGLMFVGKDETGERMEVVELQESPSGHPFYAAAQVRSSHFFVHHVYVTAFPQLVMLPCPVFVQFVLPTI